MKLEPISQVIITSNFNDTIDRLKEIAPPKSTFELFIKEDDNFKVSDANEVIAKAYLASQDKVYICLASNSFSDVVQNRLLKIIEEPPRNKEFIIITPSKSALLPTIKSRLPVTILNEEKESIELNLDFKNLNLESVYNFIQENKRLKPKEAIEIVESIVTKAIKSEAFNLDEGSLKLFSDARKALELGSPADFIITNVLLKLLAKKPKRVNV